MANEKLIDTVGLKYYHDTQILNGFTLNDDTQSVTHEIVSGKSYGGYYKSSFSAVGFKTTSYSGSAITAQALYKPSRVTLGTSNNIHIDFPTLSANTTTTFAVTGIDNQFSAVQSFTNGLYVGNDSSKRLYIGQDTGYNQIWSRQPIYYYAPAGTTFLTLDSTNAPSSYGLRVPDTSSYTQHETIATLSDITSAVPQMKTLNTTATTAQTTASAEVLTGTGSITLHKISKTGTYSDLVDKPTLGTAAALNTGTSAGNVPVLDSNGKLNSSILPALAITETYVVASQAAMLALDAQVGDVAIRTDVNKSFILKEAGASTLSHWQELLTPPNAVLSVNGYTGAVVLTYSDVGAAPDNGWTVATTSQIDAAFA